MFLRSSTVRPAGRRFIMSALLAAALASPAHAEVLTLRDALGASLKQHPDLQTFQFRFKAAEAVRGQAGQRPAPELSVGFDNFAGSGSYRGVDEAEATLSLSQVLELGGKRDARLAVADASYASISAERQAAQLDVLAEVTRRFIDVAELQELVTLAKRGTQLAEKTVANTQRRARAHWGFTLKGIDLHASQDFVPTVITVSTDSLFRQLNELTRLYAGLQAKEA